MMATAALATSQNVENVKAALLAKGYTVQEGEYGFFTQDMCDTIPNCYANNPASPYGLVYLPKGPREDVSTYAGWCSVLCSKDKQKSASYRLDANETVLLIGRTPPKSLYFSITSYMFDRFYPDGWSSPSKDIMGKCPKVTSSDGNRCQQFASLHNPVNMLTMNTTGGASSSWYDASFAGFMGGDVSQVSTVQDIAAQAGIPRSSHNMFPLPSGDVRLGTTSKEADGFMNMMRIAFTDSATAAQDYYKTAPVTVLRVTPPVAPSPALTPFPRPTLSKRGDDMEATPVMSFEELQSAVTQQLYAGVHAAYGVKYPHVESYTLTPPTFSDGYDCLGDGTICNGDSMDTTYPNSRVEILRGELCVKALNTTCPIARRPSLGKEDFYIVTGVNHNATDKSLYSSTVMYDFARLESVGQFDSSNGNSSYTGSAHQYLQDAPDTAQYLYAIKFARNCNGEKFCTEVPYSGPNSLPAEAPALFIERMYMDPLYESGPSLNSAVMAVVHHFSPTFLEGDAQVTPL